MSGNLPPGARVAPVRELSSEYGVNPNTVQRALAALEAEGLLRTERTTGRFVTGDVELIEALRTRLHRQAVRDYIGKLRDMGLTRPQIEALTAQYWEEM